MFSLAILIGIYSYLIFFLGVFGLLYKPLIGLVTLLYFFIIVTIFKRNIKTLVNNIKLKRVKDFLNKDKVLFIFLFLLSAEILINLVGVFGPETSFDALWYHLTLPKIYLLQHKISHIPGNLLFYSDMPKLTEMLYLSSITFFNEYLAKLIHFSFGAFSLLAIYNISRKFFSKKLSVLACLVFYSNLVVGWESVSAYIDLSRTFFEIMTLWAFINWVEKKERKWLINSAIMLGLAISAKVIALESLIIFLVLIIYLYILNKEKIINSLQNIVTFILFSVIIPMPWLMFSYINTGNPLYPFFDKRIDIGTSFIIPNLGNFLKDFGNLFIFSNDPISPIYLIAFPLLIVFFYNSKKNLKIIYIYIVLAVFLWYITPRVGGGRFIVPYLPALSILAVYPLSVLKNVKLKYFLITLIILVSVSSIGYRFIANLRYVPVILGKETKTEYLTKHLNFSFGDFYDTDNYFKNNIKPTDKVLLFGFHNLYYVDFPFIDSSWVKKGDKFNYIAVQNSVLPEKFINWHQIYYNPITKVKLYSLGGKQWVY